MRVEGEEEEEAEIFKLPKKMFSFFPREYIAKLACFTAASTDNISDFL